jgi:succinate dehydrogenase / fumarate reductase cytochrome b subunit
MGMQRKVEYKKAGFLSWLLRRLTGLGLAAYLLLHIWVLHSLTAGAQQFDQIMELLNNPLFKVLEIGLLFLVVYHGLDGVRVLIVDFFGQSALERKLFWGLMAAGVVLLIVGGAPILLFALAPR